MQNQPNQNNQDQGQGQWRVTFYEQGEEPLVEIMRTFADAWAVSAPYPGDDGLQWARSNRANVEARFAAGENSIVVSRASQVTYTVIERI